MTPDPKWLDAIKLPTQFMLGLFITCVALLALDEYTILKLETFGVHTKAFVIVGSVLTGALSITGIGAFIKDQLFFGRKQSLLSSRREIRAKEVYARQEQSQKAIIGRIDHLCSEELRYLADCLREGSQSFYTWAHSPHAATLMSKGLVTTPGGTYHQDHYPFSISDFVWQSLIERKAEILQRDDENRKREEAERRRR